LPAQPTAAAIVRASLEASRRAGDRRYDVRAEFEGQPGEIHYATLDVRDPDHYVISVTLSGGDILVVGRDEQSDWAIKYEGVMDPPPPRRLLPSWVKSGGGAVGIVSVDDVLAELGEAYSLRRAPMEAPPSGGPACQRISALRGASGEPGGPDR